MKQGDIIRNMTDEELASFLSDSTETATAMASARLKVLFLSKRKQRGTNIRCPTAIKYSALRNLF